MLALLSLVHTPPQFHPFTGEHYVTIAIGLCITAAFLMAGRKNDSAQRRTTGLLATINLLACPLSLLAWIFVDAPKSVDNFLPLQLCDLAAIAAGLALLTRRPWLCALTYFWGLAATLQALLTPAITVGFPEPAFVMFFVQHFAIVIAALYLPVVLGWRPKRPWWRGPLEVFGFSVTYLFVVLAVNRGLGSNFAFVSHPPTNPSLIDHLGPWPWYIFSLLGLALTFFVVLALPFVNSSGRPPEVGNPPRKS